MQNPLLSIGIIFRNDIRCIERCLKALQPLRDAIPCELVMADTGSEDGSREIAEQYADILFDFPWVNDFAAARNAVMDKCSGAWYLTVDTDEYLQPDISELALFLTAGNDNPEDFGIVTIRNHTNYELNGDYSDFMALRMARMGKGTRYVGSIHETLTPREVDKGQLIRALPRIIFDHDGYVGLATSEKGKKKRERNLKLMRQRLINEPKALALRLELLDSAVDEPDFVELVRDAVRVLKGKPDGWERNGASLLRNAIYAADVKKLPERDEWIQMAWDWYPNSLFTRIDVEYAQFTIALQEKRYDECVERGERYRKAIKDYHAGVNIADRMYGVLAATAPNKEEEMKVALADVCCKTERLEQTFELLGTVDCTRLDSLHMAELMATVQELHYRSGLDTSSLITRLWDSVSEEKPSKEEADVRVNIFLQIAGAAFAAENQEKEREKPDFCRYAYTLYLPLRGRCEIGAAAAIMEETAPEEIEAILAEVDDWTRFPIHALRYALEQGVRFPLPDKPLNIEEMDSLAGRLAGDSKRFFPLALQIAKNAAPEDWQSMCWARGLLLAAVQVFPWGGEEPETETGLALVRAFARAEKDFLLRCYMPDVLTEKQLFLLPPLHRFGWYCAQAFDALDAGDSTGYVRLLREGLAVSTGMKKMVEFLIDHMPEIQAPRPSGELLALAEKVRVILSAYPADDPAVAALKQSAAYQQVAHLIEGPNLGVFGGLPQ